MGEIQRTAMDAIGTQIAWSRLVGLADEASAMLQKTSFSPIVRESHDFSCLLLDATGDVVVQEDLALTVFIYSAQEALKAILKERPASDWQPGEMFGTNDPWLGSADLHDLHLFSPVFRDGRVIAFAGSVVHWPDIGGRQWSSNAREVFEEGLRIPPMQIMRAGELDAAFVGLVRANVRVPHQVLGDLQAQVVSNRTMTSGLNHLLDDGIIDDFERFAAQIKDLSETAMRRAIADFPDGEYRYEIDLDGIDKPMRLRAKVTVLGSEIVVDFSQSSDQVAFGINSARNYSVGAAMLGAKSMLDPGTPNNAGSFRPVTFITKPGTIVDARFPVATGGRQATGHFTAMCVFGALSQAPGVRTVAEYGNLWVLMMTSSAADPPWVSTFILSSGIGARSDSDGWSCRMFPHNAAGTSIEIIENSAPILVHRKMFSSGSGGDGKFRGGLGQEVEVELLGSNEATVTVMGDKFTFPPQGVSGGLPGRPGSLVVGGQEIPAKAVFNLAPGQRVVLRTPGGGGNGPAAARSPQAVRLDLEHGLILSGLARTESEG